MKNGAALLAACWVGAMAWPGVGLAAPAPTVLEEWGSVTLPPAPVAKPVTLDAKTTVLLVMDLMHQVCTPERPRCQAVLPAVQKLIQTAEAKGVKVIWTVVLGGKGTDFFPSVAPPAGATVVAGKADKFHDTDLAKLLQADGAKTVIAVGAVAEGAVLYTASDASLQGYKVVVPVDGMPSGSLFGEAVAAWMLTHAPTIAQNITLTTSGTISFE